MLDTFSSEQKAELLLEPNNLSNETLVRLVLTELTVEDLGSFFDKFANGAVKVSNIMTLSVFCCSQKVYPQKYILTKVFSFSFLSFLF